jgi:hypothetical protein
MPAMSHHALAATAAMFKNPVPPKLPHPKSGPGDGNEKIPWLQAFSGADERI